MKRPWADGVMGEIVAEDRQEGVERFWDGFETLGFGQGKKTFVS